MFNGKSLILIVDDEPKIRILVSKWLIDDGYLIDTASDGNDCINKTNINTDLILLDIMMPGPTPDEIINEVVRKNPHVKIAYLTAVDAFSPTKQQEEKGWIASIKPPVIGYIQKPVESEELLKKVKSYIKKKITAMTLKKHEMTKY